MVLIKNELLMETLIRFGRTRIALVLVGLSLCFAANANVRVNEVMPCNISTYIKNQNYNGWVELFNDANKSVDLQGYKIIHYELKKDGSTEKEWEWKIGETSISSTGYKVFCFDGSETDSKTERKLDSDGGAIVLKNKSGAVVDSFKYGAMQTHISYGIYNGEYGYMEPTPKGENSQSYKSLSSRCGKPYFEGMLPGVVSYNNSVIKIKTQTEGATIYYTTDGSEPTDVKGEKYNSNGIIVSNIIKKQDESIIIRARAYKNGMISSAILTGTFISAYASHGGCEKSQLPIVSIVTDTANLYNPINGIYTEGSPNNEYSVNPNYGCLPDKKLNYVMDWARAANFEYFVDEKQVLSHEVDIAVMGGCSRKYETKSLKIKAGNRMGAGNGKLKYDFFADKLGNEYKSLQLRNGGNGHEARYIRCRDGFMQSIAKNMGIDYQAYQPVAFYLNGEYRGLMGLRERTNKAFVESNYGIGSKDIDVIEITNREGIVATCGDLEAYNHLVNFLSNNDPKSDSYYTEAAKLMDMEEYMNYQIFEQFIVNTDWPANNCKIWRERNNGRFRWISFDTDFGLGLYGEGDDNHCTPDVDMFKWSKGEGSRFNWANGERNVGFTEDTKWKTIIFSSLMKNSTFREKFLTKYLIHLGTSLKYDKIRTTWDSISALVYNEYCATFEGKTNLSDAGMLSFAQARPGKIYNQMLNKDNFPELSGSSLVDLNLTSSLSAGRILMNGELIPTSNISSKYFSGKELKLEAVAPFGYKFLGWKGEGESSAQAAVEDDPIDTVGLEYTHTREWKYYTSKDGKSNSKWRYDDYNDSEWLPGFGVMGYNDDDNSDFNTVIESGNKGNHYAAVYFRSVFNLENVENIRGIVARIKFDDSYVLYVNGKKVRASNIDPSQISGTSFSSTWANDSIEIVIIPNSALKEGTNIFAVEVHQHKAESSDLKLFFEESIVYGSPSVSEPSSGEYISTNPIYRTTVNGDLNLTAVFEKLSGCEQPDIRINEICASNMKGSGTSDEFGNYSDWFEIYNDGDETVNLAGLFLTDKAENETKFMIPYGYEETKVAPKDRILIWADNLSYRGPLHAGFKLKNLAGSYVAINMKCGNNVYSIDEVEYDYVDENMSYGLLNDGGNQWVTFGECSGGRVFYPTPGVANSSRVCDSDECMSIITDVEEVKQDEEGPISIYPNPTSDVLNVKVAGEGSIDIFLYDNLGRLLNVYDRMNPISSIDLRKLASGIYHVELFTEKAIYKETIIKE